MGEPIIRYGNFFYFKKERLFYDSYFKTNIVIILKYKYLHWENKIIKNIIV